MSIFFDAIDWTSCSESAIAHITAALDDHEPPHKKPNGEWARRISRRDDIPRRRVYRRIA
jgi:hypothetical protein